MENISISNDIRVFYTEADSFPDGILAAHQKLHSVVQFNPERKYFGLSRPENGPIKYKAAATEMFEGEAIAWNCPSLVLKKGTYISITIKDYLKNLEGINDAFSILLSQPEIDPEGYCVEWYINEKDVQCMVRLRF